MNELTPTRFTFAGVFFVALSTLMYEVLLTRIFSVTMWYHFAFVAVSIAMFGMTVGALVVYLRPDAFTPERIRPQLAFYAVVFPISLVWSFLTQLSVPFIVHPSLVAAYAIAFTYAVVAVPFVVSGIVIAAALMSFRKRVSEVYAADLFGAGLGCMLLVYVLRWTDAPTAVFVIAFVASFGGIALAHDAGRRRYRQFALLTALALGGFSVVHTGFVWRQFPILRILYIKGAFEARPLYEKWNSFSRVRVNGDRNRLEAPYAWGLSRTYPSDRRVQQLHMDIDVNAGTPILRYDGTLEPLDHLKYDVTNFAYYLRPAPSALVVGTGGGRDILSALAFGARAVTGVELNGDILKTVNETFGDFSGHLDRDRRVRFVNDEARSFIARDSGRYDVIQISLIDTWAATAAGAFVLGENALYTKEAWRIFIRHLNERGLLSVSRWYFRDQPGEMYRLVTLASTALRELGVSRPREHLLIVRNRPAVRNGIEGPDGVGTLLVSRTPFSSSDVALASETAGRLAFDVMLTPSQAADPTLMRLTGDDLGAFLEDFPLNISAPTDDSPFFFQMLRLRDMFDLSLLSQGKASHNMLAVFVLGALLTTVVILTLLCVFLPLAMNASRTDLRGSGSLLLFFASIGLGFMLIETSQMQRLIIVLGHPIYGLSVVLFALLLSSGAGSLCSNLQAVRNLRYAGLRRLGAILLVLIAFGWGTPWVVGQVEAASTPVRILVAVAMLAPAGFLMGMAFPLGMTWASKRSPALTPWLWGVNGATSILASVLATVIALTWSISAAFWVGTAAYVVAALAFARGTVALEESADEQAPMRVLAESAH